MTYFNTVKVIEQIAQHPVLWDSSYSDYKNKQVRKEIWSEICAEVTDGYDEMDESEKENVEKRIIAKWRTVRDNYAKYRKKMKEMRSPLTGKKQCHRYVYSDNLTFLDRILNLKELNKNVTEEDESADIFFESFSEEPIEIRKKIPKIKISAIHSVNAPIKSEKKSMPIEDLLEDDSWDHPRTSKKKSENEEEDYDGDLSFFKSILPLMKNLDQQKKLEFRLHVMSTLQTLIEDSNS